MSAHASRISSRWGPRGEGDLVKIAKNHIGIYGHVTEIPERRHGTGFAVGKCILELEFSCEFDTLPAGGGP